MIGEKPEAAGMDDAAGCFEPGGENPAAVAPSGWGLLCEVGLFAVVAMAVGLLWFGGWNVPVFEAAAVCATAAAAGALVGVGPSCSVG